MCTTYIIICIKCNYRITCEVNIDLLDPKCSLYQKSVLYEFSVVYNRLLKNVGVYSCMKFF